MACTSIGRRPLRPLTGCVGRSRGRKWSRMRQTVTRLRPQISESRNGDLRPDWALTPAQLDVHGCSLAPEAGSELVAEGRQGHPQRWALYGPAGADIAPRDRIVATQGTFEVQGWPEQWESRFGGFGGSVTRLERVNG